MKFSRPVAVVAAVALLTGGVVAADAATTTNPVTLCANSKTGSVEVPKNGACAKGTTQFFVASQSDVATLAARMDAVELVDTTQSGDISSLQTLTSTQAGKISALETLTSTQAGKISALETLTSTQANQLSSQADQIAALQATLERLKPGELQLTSTAIYAGSIYHYSVVGSELEPGTPVYRTFENSFWGSEVIGQVAADGTFTVTDLAGQCAFGPIYIEATREADWGPIRTPTRTGAGC